MDVLEQKDSQEQPVVAENVANEAVAPVSTIDEDDADEASQTTNEDFKALSKEQLVEKAQNILSNAVTVSGIRNDLESIKVYFYRILNQEKDEAKAKFVADGGAEADFQPEKDELEVKLKEVLSEYKKRKQDEAKKQEIERQANLDKKSALIVSLTELINSTDTDYGKKFPAFNKIKDEWKTIGPVPATEATKMRECFQKLVEQFYDNVKINDEMRDYDFRKNLDAKLAICDEAEALDAEADVVSAFKKLQILHERWAEIGPAAKDKREELWNRFKEASTKINKKHNDYFDKLRAAENDNLEKKTAICEKIEAIETDKLDSFKDWQDKADEIVALQGEWRKIGFAPKKYNTSIYERFRAACDKFFNAKNDFFKSAKAEYVENLNKKVALCEQAEALKDSTDWKATTEKLVQLQKDWKTIGTVPRKQADAVWKRFIAACDFFFDAKAKQHKSVKTEEQENLDKKKSIIEKIQTLEIGEDRDAASQQLHALIDEWNAVGHVPFKEKDNIYKTYKAAIDEKFDTLNVRKSQGRKGGARTEAEPKNERAKLMRQKANIEADIITYQNNIGFLASSKKASSLKDSIEKKIADLKEELKNIETRIAELKDAESK